MMGRNLSRKLLATVATGVLTLGFLSLPDLATAQVATSPYKLSVFATAANGYSQPDSIVQWRDSVLVGFQNHVAKDGTDGKSSTIVQYSLSGAVQRTFTVPGHNDGLRLVGDDELWSLQNEDANPNLVVINLRTGQQETLAFPPTPHGGYDDLVVFGDDVFITASNPNLDANNLNQFPALLRITLRHDQIHLEPVLPGTGQAIDIPSGNTVPYTLTDPDSLTKDQRGNIVLDSQADSLLVFIRHPLSDEQTVGTLKITTSAGATTTLDDTAFAPNRPSFTLTSDVAGDKVYRIDSTFGFEPGTAYSASDTDGFVGVLNLDTGVVSPIATGFGSSRGVIFVQPQDEDDRGDR